MHKLVFNIFWLKRYRVLWKCFLLSFWQVLGGMIASSSGTALPYLFSWPWGLSIHPSVRWGGEGVSLCSDLPPALAESARCVSLAAHLQIKCMLAAVCQWPFELRSFLRWHQGHGVHVDLNDPRSSSQPCVTGLWATAVRCAKLKTFRFRSGFSVNFHDWARSYQPW